MPPYFLNRFWEKVPEKKGKRRNGKRSGVRDLFQWLKGIGSPECVDAVVTANSEINTHYSEVSFLMA